LVRSNPARFKASKILLMSSRVSKRRAMVICQIYQ
jgi:hypothetical protein